MPSRRIFLQRAAALSATAFVRGSIPGCVARAAAIEPRRGTTFHDAEHIVVLMQENRSFDHAFGALRGVRGFRDPRVHVQPDSSPVWFQRDADGVAAAPFRLDITGTNATWIGGLPHNWTDQVDAMNGGRYDKWLIANPKRGLPFTLGHYARDDVPFYYALADAFTICDQAFCSSLTGTTANRLHLWTGTIRRDAADAPRLYNSDTIYDREASWTTFPERLEDAGVSWRIYQNEISIDTGLDGDEDAWLANFTDNPIEWFTQYGVRFAPSRRKYLPELIAGLPARIAEAEAAAQAPGITDAERVRRQTRAAEFAALLPAVKAELPRYDHQAWLAVSARTRALHQKAFTTNAADPRYRKLATLRYDDRGTSRDMQVPAGDVLYQFRRDVMRNELPAISWLIGPENFSDHPSAPWYGAWYVAEALDILTTNPAVWQKTIFILCYDENDGYFDHVPPFTAPHTDRPETGRASSGIDTRIDWADVDGRNHSIGLGYRVPLVVASPWSRGGCVNSQVFDHTSVLRLMETWLAARGKPVRETNISPWRRLVCGDLSSAFRPWDGASFPLPGPLDRDATVERIYSAKFEPPPTAPTVHTAFAAAMGTVREQQEAGRRPSCPLPYELHVNAERDGDRLTLTLEARNKAFGAAAQGAPFSAYAYSGNGGMTSRAYAVRAGDAVRDEWRLVDGYHLRIAGPNGFLRSFRDGATAMPLRVAVDHPSGHGAHSVKATLKNESDRTLQVAVQDESYGASAQMITITPEARSAVTIDTSSSHGWYDFTVATGELNYRYAGRIETGEWSVSDPAM
ncbi:MAG: phosphocholine-specific phospholipase C [Gemmatimonadales bacterium]